MPQPHAHGVDEDADDEEAQADLQHLFGDEEEAYVVAANQNTNNATLYARNAADGSLTPLVKNIQVPEGTHVLFTE